MAREVQHNEIVHFCLAQQLLDALTDRPMGLVRGSALDLEGANLRIAQDSGKSLGIVGRSAKAWSPASSYSSIATIRARRLPGILITARSTDELRHEPVLLVV